MAFVIFHLSFVIGHASTLTLTLTNSLGQPDTNVIRVLPAADEKPVLANGTVITKSPIATKFTPDSNGVVNIYLSTGNYQFTNAALGRSFVWRFPDSTTNATAYPLSGNNMFETVVQTIYTNTAIAAGFGITNLPSTGAAAIGLDPSVVATIPVANATNAKYSGTASNLLGTLPLTQLPPQATTNGSLLARGYYGKPGIFTAFDAAAFSSVSTNDQSISLISDLIGTNYLNAIAVKFRAAGMNGYHALIFNQSTSIASNANYFARVPSLNTNVTMFFVYSVLTTVSNYNDGQLLTCGNPSFLTGFAIDGMEGGKGSVKLIGKTNAISTTADVRGNYETHVYAVRYDGFYVDTWLDGMISVLGRVGANGLPPASQAGGIGLNGNLYIGNYADSQKTPNYALSKILIYTNALSYADVQDVNRELCGEYGVRASIGLVGDSITVGDKTTAGNTLISIIGNALQQYQIVQSAGSANNSFQMLTNMTGAGGWAGSVPVEDGFIFIPYTIANDYGGGFTVPQLCTNLLKMRDVSHTNNYFMGVVTAMSSVAMDAAGYNTNFNNWVYANSDQFDFVVDLGAVPALSTNGASTNTNLFDVDGTHPKPAGYRIMASVYAAAIQKFLARLTSGFDASGLTNASPSIATNAPTASNGQVFVKRGGNLSLENPMETAIFADLAYDQSGSLTRESSPFLGAMFLDKLYGATQTLIPFQMSRLAPFALASGKTNLVCQLSLISTNQITAFNYKVILYAATNNPATGLGGLYMPLNDVSFAIPAQTIYPSNWFSISTTSAIPNAVWSNVGGRARFSIYNNCTTNCWLGGMKFFVQ